MRIAIDVKGTILGYRGGLILSLIPKLQERGHEVVIWSSFYAFASEAVKTFAISCEAESKLEKCETEKRDWFDVAIDDENQTFLATNQLLLVDSLPDNVEACIELIEKGSK